MTLTNGWKMADDVLTWVGHTGPDPQGKNHTLTAVVRMEPEPPEMPEAGPEPQDPRGRMPEDKYGEGFYLRLMLDGKPQTVLMFDGPVWGESIPDFARRNPADDCIGRVIQVVQANLRQKTRQEGETP